jgi:hypothetical protein
MAMGMYGVLIVGVVLVIALVCVLIYRLTAATPAERIRQVEAKQRSGVDDLRSVEPHAQAPNLDSPRRGDYRGNF